jgi:glycosyltransferase involved in cell wall biosynthesis
VRIVHVTSSLAASAGGVARAALDSAYALASEGGPGVEVALLSYDRGPFDFPWGARTPENLRVKLVASEGRDNRATAPMGAALREALAGGGAVLHLHGMWEPLLSTAAGIARRAGIPYVCSVHGMLDPWSVSQRRLKKRVYYQLVEKGRLGRAAALHFTAEGELDKALPWVPEGPERLVIPVIMDLGPFRELPEREAAHGFFPGIAAGSPWVLFLSRIHEKKGLDVLIDAVAKLPRKDVQMVVAGTGADSYVAAMKARARAAGIGERTHFVGLVRGEQKVALLRRAEMLALPTSQENFGIVFPEALACETPVLLTKDVDIYEAVLKAGAGLLITREAGDVAERIGVLLGDAGAARAKGAAGRRWVLETLEPARIARQWLAAYRGLAGFAEGSGRAGGGR